MMIYPHFSVVGFCNTYIVSPERSGDAILIDPGHIDGELITEIERRKLHIRTVLITHAHDAHIKGLATLSRIYQFDVRAANPMALDWPATPVTDNQILDIAGMKVRVIAVPGHSLDSVVYLIDHAIFSGDTLLCSRIGRTAGLMEQRLLVKTIEKKVMSLDENCLLFPGHGPISKLRTERIFNRALMERRPVYRF